MDDYMSFIEFFLDAEPYITPVLIAAEIVVAGLAFIPASIARKKGYNFGTWWLYGWLLFIVAIIHSIVLPDKNAQQAPINAASINSYRPLADEGKSAKVKMVKSNKGNIYAIIAAICYAIYAVYNIYVIISLRIDASYSVSWVNYVNVLFLIAFAITLFMKNTKAVFFVAVANALFKMRFIISLINGYYSIWTISSMIASVALVLILVLALRKKATVKYVWFIPGLAMLIGEIFRNTFISFRFWLKYDLINYTVSFVMIFIGLWLRSRVLSVVIAPVSAPVSAYEPTIPNTISNNSVSDVEIDGADDLKKLIKLRDSGSITQEEFDKRIKQIIDF